MVVRRGGMLELQGRSEETGPIGGIDLGGSKDRRCIVTGVVTTVVGSGLTAAEPQPRRFQGNLGT